MERVISDPAEEEIPGIEDVIDVLISGVRDTSLELTTIPLEDTNVVDIVSLTELSDEEEIVTIVGPSLTENVSVNDVLSIADNVCVSVIIVSVTKLNEVSISVVVDILVDISGVTE